MTATIVVGYDGHPASGRALDRAIEEAKRVDASILVVVVVPAIDADVPSYLDPRPPEDIARPEPPEIEPLVEAARERVEAAGIPFDYLWYEGDPARTIADAARDAQATTIVIGRHEHTRFQRFLGEDVDAEVQKHSDANVILVD